MTYEGREGYYWSSVARSSGGAYYLYFGGSDLYVGNYYSMHYGFSVRCVR
ncbi:MAG: hypothetical protein K2N21_08105 [Rikenellaceae bacterium]|nr:hypothetical protein [Rikenellaceae bacterium]